MDHTELTELVVRAQRGDNAALSELYGHAPITVLNGWVYYINGSDDAVYRIRTDGTETQKLAGDGSCNDVFSSGGYVYYTSYESGMHKTYVMNPDGSEKKLLYSGEYNFGHHIAFVIGDTLYCYEDQGK